MRTKRWIGPLLGLMLALAFAGQLSQSQRVIAAGCATPTYETTADEKGSPMKVVSFDALTCFNVQAGQDEVIIVGAFDNKLTDGATVLHDVQSSIKALKWDGVVRADVSYGQIRLVPASRAQCVFETWFAAEQNFPRDHAYPLDEWAGQTAVCGPLDGGSSGNFVVDAPKVVPPDTKVTIKVTSDPSGQAATLAIGSETPVTVNTPFTATFASPAGQGQIVPWVLKVGGDQVDAGEIDVLPTRSCFALPSQDSWNEGPVPFSFSTDEDKSGGSVLHICGDMASGYMLLVSGEAVAGEAYGVLTTLTGHVDTYVRNAFIEGVAGCSAATEFARLKKEGGSNLTIFHEPSACRARGYLPLMKHS